MPLQTILSPRNGHYLGQVLADYLMHHRSSLSLFLA